MLEVIGAEGRVLLITASNGTQTLQLPERIDFFADFLAELTGQGEHLISQEDAFRLTELCLVARNAAQTGKWTDV